MHTTVRALILSALLCGVTTAHAECFAPHQFTGEVVPAREISGLTGLFEAAAAYTPNGYPTITYGPAFRKDPPALQEFIRMRECARLLLRTADELTATCFALVQVRRHGLAPQAEGLIEQYQLANARVQDAGSNLAFWEQTLACANGPNPF
jgi:hypothetical protein